MSWERWEGTIEYTFMAPIHRLTHLGGMCLFAICYGAIRTIIVLAAVTFFFDISLAGANLVAGMAVLVVSSLSFIGLGLMAAVLPLMSPEKGSQATHIIQGFILLISVSTTKLRYCQSGCSPCQGFPQPLTPSGLPGRLYWKGQILVSSAPS